MSDELRKAILDVIKELSHDGAECSFWDKIARLTYLFDREKREEEE